MKNELKQFSKKRNILMTLFDEMPALQNTFYIIIIAMYFIFIDFCLNKINRYFNYNLVWYDIWFFAVLIGLTLPVIPFLIHFLIKFICGNISHIKAIINYTRLPLTSEELILGISNQLFSNADTYLEFLEKKLKYKWLDDTKYINISYSDLFVILKSIKEVFGDDKIYILSYFEKQESYGYMQNVLPFYNTLDDISDKFVNYHDEIMVSLQNENDTLIYHITNHIYNIDKDLHIQFMDENKTVHKLFYWTNFIM